MKIFLASSLSIIQIKSKVERLKSDQRFGSRCQLGSLLSKSTLLPAASSPALSHPPYSTIASIGIVETSLPVDRSLIDLSIVSYIDASDLQPCALLFGPLLLLPIKN